MKDKNIFANSIYDNLSLFELTGLALRDFFSAAEMTARQRALRQLYPQCKAWDDSAWLEMEYDFSALFVGPMAPLAAPYASVWLDEEPLVMGPTTLNVREFLDSVGLVVGEDSAAPDDHISIELELVVMLCAHARHLPQYHDALTRFTTGHLALWLPAFIDNIKNNAKTSAIREVALQLTNWLDELKTRVIL
ncbi:Putative oxidoreductase component of anaerobic dehydrogenases; Functional role page for Chaperone protein TorD [Enterobacter cancerogenus]|uniref:Oxidoreductase component of anaerobic dehydrogenases Functional role page for Chaperone protein TorD n=2 Tax=Enterobacter cancerogenus TaxID=69218 RepID=A0A484X300_9ENTR|nr:Putative oxidoreductase component of anaerobic dehydrogenases; Functional role page for Chaperone protein TorD [Enterobacter cancerogenus]